MTDHVRVLLNWLRYAEYVLAWSEIPMGERSRYHVVRIDDEWKAMPL